MNGIDISKHNGSCDLAKAKQSGIDFAIIRAGYGKSVSQKDERFEENYKKAVDAGMHVGAYWYSYAKNVEEARQEAEACLQVIKGKKFDMPIYYDIEEDCNKPVANEIAKEFCSRLEAQGYFVGIYCSKSYIETYFNSFTRESYCMWVAQWANSCTYSGQFGIWQYSDSGTVPGIAGNVDMNKCLIDYPSLITGKGFNGYEYDIDKDPDNPYETHLIQVIIDGKEVFRNEY